jgi:hypothetical protein
LNLKSYLILLVIALFSGPIAKAQEPCGTQMDDDFYQHFMTKDMSYLNSEGGRSAVQWVPVQYHIVGRDNGTGYYNVRDLVALHCELNERFATVDIQFYLYAMPNYINNSDYYEFSSTWTGNGMMNQHNVLEACNVYIVEDPRGVCGYAFYPGSGPRRGGIVLKKSCAAPGSTTLTHEMGHYFGLPHTFSGWENGNTPSSAQQERVNGSNCSTAGDRFCDTPADFISSRWSCPYTGSQTDLNGDLYRTVLDGTLYMSYSNDGCQDKFSPNQMTEMYNVLPSERSYLLNGPTINPVVLDTPELVSPANGFDQLAYNYVNLKWKTVPGAEYYHVLVSRFLNPNQFNIDTIVSDTSVLLQNLQGSYSYRWSVKALSKDNFCGPRSEQSNFITTNISVTVNYFLPSCSGEDDGALGLEVNGGQLPYSYNWSNGINQNPQGFLTAGNYQVTVNDGGNQSVIVDVDLRDPDPLVVDVEPIGNGFLRAMVSGGVPPYTYQWPDGTNDRDWYAPNTGSFTLNVTDANTCSRSKTYAFTSIGESLAQFENIKLYPNPATQGQSLHLSFIGNAGEETSISVWSLDGRMISQEVFYPANDEINRQISTETLSSGLYLLVLQSGSNKEVVRFSYLD